MANFWILLFLIVVAFLRSKNGMGFNGTSAVNIYFGLKLILNAIGLLVLIISALFFLIMLS